MNAILQALFFSVKFRSSILQIDHDYYQEQAHENAVKKYEPSKIPSKLGLYFQSSLMQLQKLFALLLKSTRPYITPTAFRNTLPDYFRKSFLQQDASEFFKVLSDSLEQDCKLVSPEPHLNVFIKNFENKMKVKIVCGDCQSEIIKEESFTDLFIPIELPDSETYFFDF